MTGYGISDVDVFIRILVLIGCIPLVGYLITCFPISTARRCLAWMFTIGSVTIVERFSDGQPAGTRMVLIIVALLWGMKSVVAVEACGKDRMPLRNWLSFTTLWFGMRPELFRRFSGEPIRDWTEHVRRGLVRVALGGVLILFARIVIHSGQFETDFATIERWRLWIVTGLLLPGLSLLIHFGLFNLLTGFWRWRGVKCNVLFRAPLNSASLNEFWSRRWNLAFSEMTAKAVFRPLKRSMASHGLTTKTCTATATICAFVFSGLLHELAISVPVQSGYGFPTLYFALHAAAMVIENRLGQTGSSLLRHPIAGRVWTAAWVLLPLPILFHRPFLEGCIWPLLQ